MAEVMPLGSAVHHAAVGHHGGHAGHAWRRQVAPGFHHVLAAALGHSRVPRTAAVATAGVQTAALYVPFAVPHAAPAEKPASILPAQSDAALQQAMTIEGVPQSWRPGLQFIMAQESAGQVGARNPVHSARGLYQLTRANYHLNPNGERSFGNAVEEAQGGIRYIQQRYGTADNAVAFWRQHRWY
jgi:Transglycosylase SLT domain